MKYLDHVEYGHWTEGHYVSKQFDFEAGKEYYLVFYAYFLYDGDYTFSLHKTIPPTEITLSQTTIKGFVGEEIELSYKLLPTYSFAENVTWSSENDAIASVNNGVVKLNSVGSTSIIATTESGVQAVCSVNVEDIPSLELGTTNVEITNPGDAAVYSFVAQDAGTYVFYSTNSSRDTFGYVYDEDMNEIASDDDSGEGNNFRIQFELSEGEQCYLKAKFLSSDTTGLFDIVLYKLVQAESMTIKQGNELSAYKGTSISLSTVFSPENAIIEGCTWASDNEAVATVDEYGYVTFNSEGTVTITATSDSGLTAQCHITVTDFETISVGETKSAVISSEGNHAYFSFTPDEDGYYAFYSNSNEDTYGYIRDEYMNTLVSDDDSGNGSNFKVKYQMTAGTTYILDARYYSSDRTGSFDVTIEQTKFITKLEIESLPTKMDYIKGFASGNLDYEGLVLKATWSDGTITFFETAKQAPYIEDERVYFYDYSVDDDGIIRISCGGQEVQYQLNLIDNPVSSLEIVQGTNQSYVENYGGYFTTWYNDETGEEEQVYNYNTNYPSDAIIKVNYNDGTSKTARIGDRLDGYSISWNSNQNSKPWHVGTDNESIVSYLGFTVNLPITVNANTVENIEVKTGTSTEFIENAYGYWDSRWDSEAEEYVEFYRYNVWSSEFSDAVIQINYTDGTSKTAKINEEVDGYWIGLNDNQYEHSWSLGSDNYLTVSYLGKETKLYVTVVANPVDHIEVTSAPTREYIYGDNTYGATNSDGSYDFSPTDLTGLVLTVYYTDGSSKQFEPVGGDSWGSFDGFNYSIDYDGYNPELGDFPVTFNYMGKTAEYTVVIKEAPVASIEVTKLPNKTEYSEYYSPDWTGLELTIHNTDGTTDTITINSENSYYSFDPRIGNYFGFTLNGNEGYIEESWEGNEFTAVYLGKTCPIEGITFVEDKAVKNVELKNFTLNGTGTEVTVTFEDDSTEKIVIDDIVFRSYGVTANHLTVYAKTNKGILSYSVSNAYLDDEFDEDDYYDVWIFGKEIRVDKSTALIGDVNGDGEITSKDVTILRRYLAGGWNVEINETNSDINGDGEVTSKDVTLLRRYLAGGWGVELG